ncbi:MAG: response regulator transcription factor [Pseudomonadota bacterium]
MHDRHILVVDDDPKIRALLKACFEEEGATVSEAEDFDAVQAQFSSHAPDLVTLDIGLDGQNGFEIARILRRSHDTPIIMVTGKDDVIDRVVGLELGADDYITKPFHVREMLARAKSVLRRYECVPRRAGSEYVAKSAKTVMLDGMEMDLDRMLLRCRDGYDCDLTTADFKLLRALVENAKRPLSRDRLMDLIGGPAWVPLDRTIDNQIARLRKKIERDPARPQLIKTVRGVGYMLTQGPEEVSQPLPNTA